MFTAFGRCIIVEVLAWLHSTLGVLMNVVAAAALVPLLVWLWMLVVLFKQRGEEVW